MKIFFLLAVAATLFPSLLRACCASDADCSTQAWAPGGHCYQGYCYACFSDAECESAANPLAGFGNVFCVNGVCANRFCTNGGPGCLLQTTSANTGYPMDVCNGANSGANPFYVGRGSGCGAPPAGPRWTAPVCAPPAAGALTTSAPLCTDRPNGTCVITVSWTSTGVSSAPVNVWMNGTSFGGCQSANRGTPAVLRPGNTYYFALEIGPTACDTPTGSAVLSTATVVARAAGSHDCAPHTICGEVTSAETGAALSGIALQLRDATTGEVKQYSRTAADGRYFFPSLTQPTYYVTPVVDRTESASPSQTVVNTADSADFTVRGVPATLRFSGISAGTVLLLTPDAAYSGRALPVVAPGSAGTGSFFAATAAADGSATLQVPPGASYFLVCWEPTADGRGRYRRLPARPISSGTALNPNEVIPGIRCSEE